MPDASHEISLPAAALLLREGWTVTYGRVLRGELVARQVGRRWFVRAEDVDRVLRDRARLASAE